MYEKPLRYGKREEIHHIFKDDPQSPPKVISLVFTLAVVAMVPALLIGVSTYILREAWKGGKKERTTIR